MRHALVFCRRNGVLDYIWDCFLYFRLVYPKNDLQTKFPKTIQNWFNWIPVIKGFYQDKSEKKPVLFQLCVCFFGKYGAEARPVI